MKKKSLILGFSAILVVIGAAICMMGFWLNGGKGFYVDRTGAHSYSEEKRVENQLELSAFNSVQLETSSCEVEFVESDRYQVECNLPEGYQVEQMEVADGTLHIRVKTPIRLMFFNLNLWGEGQKDSIRVYYPSGASFETLDLSIGSGNLSGKNLQATDTKVGITSGECKLEGLTGATMAVNITSGNARLSGLRLSALELKLSSGTLQLSDTAIKEGTAFSITSGGAELTKVETGGLTAEISSGDLKLTDCQADNLQGRIISGSLRGTGIEINGMDYQISSGDLRLDGLVLGATKIHVGSGSVKINTSQSEQACGYSLSAISGSTRVNGKELTGTVKMDAENTYELSATSGDIDLNFAG